MLVLDDSASRRWKTLATRWKRCQLCPLHATHLNYVLCRGVLPCHILFIGEAPGRTEDAIGYPFIGRSGRLLNQMIEEAAAKAHRKPSFAILNTVACIPFVDNDRANDIRPPSADEQAACSAWLKAAIEIASPKRIVALGKEACKATRNMEVYEFVHPAYVLRKGGSSSVEYARFVLRLANLFKLS